MSKAIFDADNGAGKVLLHWWQGLDENRGDRAELRRAETPLAAMQLPAFHRIRARLLAVGVPDVPRLVLIAALSAHVRGSGVLNVRLPEAFSEGEKPPVSSLRFRQILDAASEEELFTRLRRVLPLVKERVNLHHLANDVFYWDDGVRKQWVYTYRWPD